MHISEPVGPGARFGVAFAVAAVPFLALDSLWLSLMADRLYRPLIGHLMRPDFDIMAGAAFYAVYLAIATVLVALPARHAPDALWRGALLGLAAYGTYDLTNQATLRDWPWTLTLADMAWGGFLTGVSMAAASAALARWARRKRA